MNRLSSDPRNSYGEDEYFSRDGRDDTVVMSVETYGRMEREILLFKIERGLRFMENGEWQCLDEAMAEIRKDLSI